MTEKLAKAATVDFEKGIATECEDKDCWVSEGLRAFVVAGEKGRNGVAVYCSTHAQEREDSEQHTYIGEITDYSPTE